MALAQKAGQKLHWLVADASENKVIWHTYSDNFTASEVVTVTIDKKNATLTCCSYNGWYEDEARNQQLAKAFAATMQALAEAHHKADRNLHPMHREKYGALLPSPSYLVTPVINYINAIVFIAMLLAGISPLHPTSQSLFMWGGNLRAATINGEWWRLITCMFLHGGAMHLLMNTYAMLYIGMFLEPLMGKFRFASTYLLTGVCASLMSIAMHPNSVSIGASGAIFGMYGVFFSILTTSHIQKAQRTTMLRSILFFIVLNLMTGMQGNTDNAAHVGGLLSGIAIGYIYYLGIKQRSSINRQIVTSCIMAACVAVGAGVVFSYLRG